MKKWKTMIAAFLAAVLLFASAGCSGQKIEANISQSAETYVAGEDFQYFLKPFWGWTQAKDGYFLLSNGLLQYLDPQTLQMRPTCSDPNCEHNNTDCPAYFMMSPSEKDSFSPIGGLDNYGDDLYLFGWQEESRALRHNFIYQVSTDTFKRQKAAYLFDSGSSMDILCTMHRGYVYFVRGGADGLDEATATLYRVPLGSTDTDNQPETVYEFTGYGANILGMSAFGNNFFFETRSYTDADGSTETTQLLCTDIHTLETRTVLESVPYSYFAADGYVYYQSDVQSLHRLDLKTGEDMLFYKTNQLCNLSADSNYIYLDNAMTMNLDERITGRVITVIDKSGNPVTTVVPRAADDQCYFGGDDLMLFSYQKQDPENPDNEITLYYALDKSTLTSDEHTFKDIG